MTTDTGALVRHAYHLAEGDVLGAQAFIDLFAEDGQPRRKTGSAVLRSRESP